MVSQKIIDLISAGKAAYTNYDYESAIAAYKKALGYLALEPDSYQKEKTYGDVFLRLVDVLDMDGQWVDAVMYVETIINIAQNKKYTQLEIEANLRAGRILIKRSLWKEALKRYENTLEITAKHISEPAAAECYYGLAFVNWRLGNIEKAKFNVEKSLTLAEKANVQHILGQSLIVLASIMDDTGDTQAAILKFEEAIEVLKEIDHLIELARAYNNLGEVYKNIGEYSKATEQFRKCVTVAKVSNNKRAETYATMNLAECLVRDRNLKEAESQIMKAEEMLSSLPEPYAAATFHFVKGLISYSKNDQKKTHKEFESTIDQFEKLDVPHDIGMAYYEYGNALQRFGRKNESIGMYKKARDNFIKSDAKLYLEKTESALKELSG